MVDVILSLLQSQVTRRIDALVRQVADLSVEGVVETVEGRTGGMSLCEMRGYIRARAAAEIRRQTRLVLARHAGAEAEWEGEITSRAADRVAPLVMRRLASSAYRRHVIPMDSGFSAARAA